MAETKRIIAERHEATQQTGTGSLAASEEPDETRPEQDARIGDIVALASEESFPASDPPS